MVAQKFQDFAQKKKLKHAGDPDVCDVIEYGFNSLILFWFVGVYQRSCSPHKTCPTIPKGIARSKCRIELFLAGCDV